MTPSDNTSMLETHVRANPNVVVEASLDLRAEDRQTKIDTLGRVLHDNPPENPREDEKPSSLVENLRMSHPVQNGETPKTASDDVAAPSVISVNPRSMPEGEFVVVRLSEEHPEGMSNLSKCCSHCMLIELENVQSSISNGTHERASGETPSTSPIPNNATRPRNDTLSSTFSSASGAQGQPALSSMFFVAQALEAIQNSKEGKRKGPLKDATAKALGMRVIYCVNW
jgi:hypothetical protein